MSILILFGFCSPNAICSMYSFVFSRSQSGLQYALVMVIGGFMSGFFGLSSMVILWAVLVVIVYVYSFNILVCIHIMAPPDPLP